jgi:metal-responsive CopG/Arc/MetJ family transcriptional regulator
MKNVNINLTTTQAKLVDQTTKDYGFANRSEFFRAVLRYVFQTEPEVLKKLDTLPFIHPPTKDVDEIIKGFKATKKYNKHFLKNLEDGLRKSDYFND